MISYFETGGARKCMPGENPYVSDYHPIESLLISSAGRNTCLMSSAQEPPLCQIRIGVKYGSILKNVKTWKTKSIDYM